MITGFVFDLDGVITDTAKFHYQAWKEAASTKLGIEIDESVNELLKGKSRMNSLHEILRFGGKEGVYSEDELVEIATFKNTRYKELIETITAADILPGMEEFLREIKSENYPVAVASASFNAPSIISRLGLTDILNKIVNPGTVKNGKPAPDLFEAAADLISSPYKTTVGFEDAAAGVEGINAAGMFSVGLGDPQILNAANLVFSNSSEISLDKIKLEMNKQNY